MQWPRLRTAVVLMVPVVCLASLGCEESFEGPIPSVEDPVAGQPLPVDPGIICRVQNPSEGNPVVVTGEKLAPVPFGIPDDARVSLPDVTLTLTGGLDGGDAGDFSVFYDGEPEGTNASLLSWQSQEQMTFRVTDGLALERGVYDVRITNANDESATTAGSLAVIDRPFVEGVSPGITCLAQGERTITISGREVLRLGDAQATATVGGQELSLDSLDDCTAVAHAGIDAELCDTATVTVPADSLQAGDHDITFQNPETAACDSLAEEDGIVLQVVDPPTLTEAAPPLICTEEEDRPLTLFGTNIFTVDGALPTVQVGGTDVTVDGVDGCEAVEVVGLDVQRCTEISVTVPQGSQAEGSIDVSLTNPDPIGCSTTDAVLTVPPAVVITSVAPASVCEGTAAPTELVVTGAGFLRIDDADFAVTFGGADVTPTNITGCTSLTVDGMAVESCTEFTLSVDLSTTAIGAVEISVENPEPSGCGTTATDVFEVVGPPDVTGVMPTNICSDRTETITVVGTNFSIGASVTINGVDADIVDVAGDGASLTATFTDGLPAGTYDVTVDNGTGCADTLTAGITVDPTPLVFFVDPPTIYNGVATEVTILTTGLTTDAQSVTLIDDAGNTTPITAFQSPTRPNRILATIPEGLTAGTYEVQVTSDIGCESVNNGTLVITDTVTLTSLSVDPSFVSPTEPTAVTISTVAGEPFVSTPRAYLNPNPAAANVTATPLRAVVFQDDTTLTAVVPGGLTSGQYDLIVVNPTGEVGVITQGITVTAQEPPVVTTVVPATFANNSDYAAEIRGLNFDAASVSVELLCEDTAGTQTTHAVTVSGQTADTIDATLPTSALSAGSICLVTVTNSDGASFTYSAISITNSSFNLQPWAAVSSMTTARRGLGLEAGRPTFTSRYLYAVGGDDGTSAGAMTSVESVNVNVFGDLGGWRAERYPLPEAKSLFGLERVGRFLYAIGGNDGAGATTTVHRAQILDPLETPEITDVDGALGDGTGLGAGLYHYRVSAIFPNTDANNPDGESLPGEVLVVDLPDVDDKLQLTLTWEQIPGASGYRIYRTPNAGDAVDALELLAEVTGGSTLSYVDQGTATTAGEVPLPDGSLGNWHAVASLNTAREAVGVVAARDPSTPALWHLYAIGGRDGSAGYLSSIEYLTITVNADGSQSYGSWQTATNSLSSAKAEHGAVRVTNDQSDLIPAGETWIYVGPGRTGASSYTGVLNYFQVPVGGDPVTVGDLDRNVSGDRSGYGFGASSDFLYIFGGPGDGGISAELELPTELQPGAWNSLGISMSDPRLFPGTTQESAFYFIAGGWDGTQALMSVDQTVQ